MEIIIEVSQEENIPYVEAMQLAIKTLREQIKQEGTDMTINAKQYFKNIYIKNLNKNFIPPSAKWISTDFDGTVTLHKEKPFIGLNDWTDYKGDYNSDKNFKIYIPFVTGKEEPLWEESLIEIQELFLSNK